MTEGQKPESGLMGELYTLGRQLTTAVKALWDSDDSRRLRQEIGDGFMDLGQQLDAAIKSAQDSEAGKQFGEQVKVTVDKARESDIAGRWRTASSPGCVSWCSDLKLVGSWMRTPLFGAAHCGFGTPPDETPVA
jgi:hypothetical protein